MNNELLLHLTNHNESKDNLIYIRQLLTTDKKDASDLSLFGTLLNIFDLLNPSEQKVLWSKLKDETITNEKMANRLGYGKGYIKYLNSQIEEKIKGPFNN
jgi:hypothetical protein